MRLLCQKKQASGIFFMFFLLFTFQQQLLFSQPTKKQITGTVTDSKGSPLTGAAVTEQGTNNGTATDTKGNFSLQVSPDATLLVSYVGYQNQTVRVGNQTNLQIRMADTASALTDVVVVGYGTQRKKDLTGSVATVNVAEAKKVSTNDITGLLQGRAPGVAVNSDGQPGAVPSVRIRGFSTFGGAAPFYVVDGVPVGTSIRDFSPNDVQSITVLKDASAASIYGAAAANGVIIITTRQGTKNAPMRIEYNGYYGWDKVWQIQDVTHRVEYQMLNNESRTNAGLPLFPANDPSNPGFVDSIDTDWQKEGLKTGTRQDHNISLSGGGNNSTYNVSLDYFDNTGTYVGNGPSYKRYTARVNTSAEKGIFKVGETFNYTHSHENSLTFRDDILLGAIPPMIVSLVTAIPTMPVYDPSLLNGFGGSNSEFNGANSLNAIAVNSTFVNWIDIDRTFGNIYGELQLLKTGGHNLRFRTSLSYDKTQTRDYSWIPAFYFGKFFSNDVARLNDNSRVYTNSSVENTLNYDAVFGKHSVQALLGQSYRENDAVLRESSATGFTQPYYPVIDQGQSRSSKGSEYVATLSSYFGRINYLYGDKYLVSATLRRDGSSRFAPDFRYGYFPAVSVGWKLSSESFWNVSRSIVSLLKLRASYGKLGNDNIGDYLYQPIVNTGIVYIFNDTRVVGGLQTSVVSPNIKWEEKTITNIGFDGTFLNGHLDFSAEYYKAKSQDVLVGVPIPATVGSINLAPVVNAATLENSGVELMLRITKSTENLRLIYLLIFLL
jgi:TonB-linked SusC/RagA family outer membrane protein